MSCCIQSQILHSLGCSVEQADVLVPKGSLATQVLMSQKPHKQWLCLAAQLTLCSPLWPWGAYSWSLWSLPCSAVFHQVKWIPLLTELLCEALQDQDKGRAKRTEVKAGGIWAEMHAVGRCRERRDDPRALTGVGSLQRRTGSEFGSWASRKLVSEAGGMWAEMGQRGVKTLLEQRQDMG